MNTMQKMMKANWIANDFAFCPKNGSRFIA